MGGDKTEEKLKMDIVSHFFLCFKSLVKTEEDVSFEAFSLPIFTCLDEQRIRTQAVKIRGCTPTEGVSTVAFGFVSSSIQKSSQFFGKPIVCDAFDAVPFLITECREAVIEMEPIEELFHMENGTQGLDRISNHGYNHVLVSKLVSLAVGLEYQADVPACWEAYLQP